MVMAKLEHIFKDGVAIPAITVQGKRERPPGRGEEPPIELRCRFVHPRLVSEAYRIYLANLSTRTWLCAPRSQSPCRTISHISGDAAAAPLAIRPRGRSWFRQDGHDRPARLRN